MNNDDTINTMFKLFKSSTEMVWGTVSKLQDQAERTANLILDQHTALQDEGRKYVEEWITTSKKNQEEFQRKYNEGIEQISKLISLECESEPEREPKPKSKSK